MTGFSVREDRASRSALLHFMYLAWQTSKISVTGGRHDFERA